MTFGIALGSNLEAHIAGLRAHEDRRLLRLLEVFADAVAAPGVGQATCTPDAERGHRFQVFEWRASLDRGEEYRLGKRLA